MIVALLTSLLGALFFAAAGCLGGLLGSTFSERITPLADGPPPEQPPVAALIAACAVIGAIITPHAAAQSQLLLIALVCVALVAVWVTDARRGIVPDVFTLGPLAIMAIVALWKHEWWLFISAAVPFVPFAVAALLSRGRGMGWGDVKLVALGGAVLGAQLAVLAFAVACLAAVLVNYKRGRKQGVIAFAPYLATAIGVTIPLVMWR
jgi:prepilin signal peptidase PulO-like enzyme (type II secretory pathway)